MTSPLPPNVPQLLVALQPLTRAAWSGRLPNCPAGQPFWASLFDTPSLIAGGLARPWAAGDPPAPPAEPPKTVHGSAGFAAGTSNSSPGH